MTTSEAGKLETDRLILRPLTVNDFEAVQWIRGSEAAPRICAVRSRELWFIQSDGAKWYAAGSLAY